MSIDFLTRLPPWPAATIDQVYWFGQLRILLTAIDTAVDAQFADIVVLEQGAEPSQADWETAYTTQTGGSLPIPNSARLFWWDTVNDVYGGSYGTVRPSDTTVHLLDNRYAPGHTVAYASAYKNNILSVTTLLGDDLANHPNVTLVLPVPANLIMAYGLFMDFTAGSGAVGIDFLIDSIKVGTQYYNLTSARGIVERATDGQLVAFAQTPVLPAGTYVVQAIFGVTNSNPTVSIGGDDGVRNLWVRGIAA